MRVERRKQPGQRYRMAGRKGQSLAEYTLILVFVALACIAAVTLFGGTVRGFYDGFNGSF